MKTQMLLINFLNMFPELNEEKLVSDIVNLRQEMDVIEQDIQKKIDEICKKYSSRKDLGWEVQREDVEKFVDIMQVLETGDTDYVITKY